jgi:hypothetical protein
MGLQILEHNRKGRWEASICMWVRKYPNITDQADRGPREPDWMETVVKFLLAGAVILLICQNILPLTPLGWIERAKKESSRVKLGIHMPLGAKEWERILQRMDLDKGEEEERVVHKEVTLVHG